MHAGTHPEEEQEEEGEKEEEEWKEVGIIRKFL